MTRPTRAPATVPRYFGNTTRVMASPAGIGGRHIIPYWLAPVTLKGELGNQ